MSRDTTAEDSMLMMRTAWQRLRASYVQDVARQKAGHAVDLSERAQLFIDMNNALELALAASGASTLSDPARPA